MNILKYAYQTAYNAVIGVPCGLFDAGKAAVNTTAGIAGTALSILTVGKSQRVNGWASYTRSSFEIFPNLYSSLIRVVYPKAYIDATHKGYVTAYVAAPVFRAALQSTVAPGFIQREIVSRVAMAVATVAAVVSRVADFALGLVGAAFSIIPCLGRVDAVNNFAISQLNSSGVVNDICRGLRGIVNPHQFGYFH